MTYGIDFDRDSESNCAAMDNHVLNTINPVVIGERLADARRARGLTQQQAAEVIGVARTTMTAMEKGERRPRASELIKLAQLYGRPVPEFVRVDTSAALSAPPFVVQFRAAQGAIEAETTADIQRFEELSRWYSELENLLGAPLPQRDPPVYDITGTPPERAAAEVASSERNRVGLGDGPLGDLWGLLESDVGLRVFSLPMSNPRLTGLFLFTEEYGGCIAVNANHPEERRRWSAVLEYAHFLSRRYQPEITVVTGERRVPDSERFADAFAGAFLMPALGLTRRFESLRRAKRRPIAPADLLTLSQRYRVSVQAMTRRLEALKLLPAGTWDRLREVGLQPDPTREVSERAARRSALPDLPRRYVALAVQAHEEGLLSEGQLAARLGTDRIGARQLARDFVTESELSETGASQLVPLDLTRALSDIA